jgi:hypothetical protein
MDIFWIRKGDGSGPTCHGDRGDRKAWVSREQAWCVDPATRGGCILVKDKGGGTHEAGRWSYRTHIYLFPISFLSF